MEGHQANDTFFLLNCNFCNCNATYLSSLKRARSRNNESKLLLKRISSLKTNVKFFLSKTGATLSFKRINFKSQFGKIYIVFFNGTFLLKSDI